MSMCRVISCVIGRGCLLWPVCSLGKTVSLWPALFCSPRLNLPVTPGVSWLPTFPFQSPIMKRTSFFVCVCVLVLEDLVGLHEAIQLKLLWHYWLGHRLGFLWYCMVCLEMNRDHSVVFEIASKYSILDSRWLRWLLHFFWGIPAHSSRYNGHLS